MKIAAAVGSFLNSMAVERSLSSNTLSAYTRDLDKYMSHLASRGVQSLESIDGDDVASFMDFLADLGLAQSSRTRSMVAVRSFHTFAVQEGWVSSNATAEVKLPKSGTHLPKVLSYEQVTALIDAAGLAEPPEGLRDRALIELLYGTGGRISEIISLDIDDVDRESATVRLFGKGRKERVLPLGSFAIDALNSYLVRARPELARKGKGTSKLFLNSLGRPLSRQSTWAIIRRAAERAGIRQDISAHTLRHTYATHLLHGGADVRVVQELLGHASVTTTQIYTSVTIDSLRETFASSHPRARKGQ